MLILSAIFLTICCEMHEHVASVSNRAVTGSVLRILMAKFYSFSLHTLDWI